MEAILLSVQPKWVEKILKGEKTIEIRKDFPKYIFPMDVYIYETIGKRYRNPRMGYLESDKRRYAEGRGKVIAKFALREVENINPHMIAANGEYAGDCYKFDGTDVLKNSCLSQKEIEDYGRVNDLHLNFLYAWHISDLVVFDKPMELGVFHKTCANDGSGCPDSDCPYYETPSYEYGEVNYDCYDLRPIKRPPQSWCFFDKIQSHCPKCLSTMEYCDGKWYCEGIMDCENKRGVLNETIF